MKLCMHAILESVEIKLFGISRPELELIYLYINIPPCKMLTDIYDRFKLKSKITKSIFSFVREGGLKCNFTAILTTFDDSCNFRIC